MRRALSLLVGWCLLAGVAGAEPVTTIRNNGSSATRVDLVVLGDGYTAADIRSGKYASDVESAVNGFFASPPYDEYRKYFNVHRIDVTSNESGADHDTPSVIRRDTALDAAYDCAGIQRLVCVNTTKVTAILTNSIPAPNARDIILVLVNDTVYGGSGGSVAVASTNAASIELVLHETGHSFGLLADEYGGPPPPSCDGTVEPAAANATKQTARNLIKWSAWIDAGTAIPTVSTTNGIAGLFEGAAYCDVGLFRPVYSSKMRALNQPFYQINSEQLVKRIYNYASPIDSVSPASTKLTLPRGTPQLFTVTTPSPVSRALTVTWKLDGKLVSSEMSFALGSSVAPGVHVVELRVSDGTNLVRQDTNGVLAATRTWTVTVDRDARSDFNADGNADILFQNNKGQLYIWYLNGTGGLASGGSFYDGALAPWRIVGTADLNNDGKTDILFQNTAGQLYVWYMNGTGGIASGRSFYDGALGDWKVVGIADLNKDGNADILFQNAAGQLYVWYMNGAGSISSGTYLYTGGLSPWKVVGLADLNNDGNVDVLFQYPSGEIYVWYMNGAGAITKGEYLYTSALGDFKVVSTADLNNDGNADILFQNNAGQLYVWYMNGAGAISSGSYFNGGQALGDWRAFAK